MKTATTLIAFLLAAAPALAQSGATATIDVRVSVIQSLSVVGAAPLDFGEIVASASGTTKRIERNSPQAGRFEVSGGPQQNIQVTFTLPDALTRPAGSGTLPLDLGLYGTHTLAAAAGAERVLQNEVVTLPEEGRYFFFVAGSLTARDETQNPPGDYTGEAQLSVSYTSI